MRPQAVVVENVRAIVTEYKGRYKDYILSMFAAIGYDMVSEVLNAADFGVPQHRRRAFFVGFDNRRITFTFPTPTHGPPALAYVGVGRAINDLAGRGSEVPNHSALRHSEKVTRRYQLIPEGGMLPPPSQIPEDIRRDNFGSTYKRLHRSHPSLTIVPGNNALPIHPYLDRSLTPREAARIQTFPDDFVFEGDRRKQCILVGNAVPPLLSAAIANAVKGHILPWRGAMARASAVKFESSLAKSELVNAKAQTLNRPGLAVDEGCGPGFVDLFSGAGGFKLGFAQAGLRPLVCADHSGVVEATHAANYGSVPFVLGDLGLPAVQERVAQLSGKEVFAVVGGPPCQGFSVFGQRRMAASTGLDPRSDPRNRLVFSFLDTVRMLNPRWVVMENVAGFVSLDDGSFVERIVQGFRDAGYGTVEHRILDAAHYGVPQRRSEIRFNRKQNGARHPLA